MLVFTSVLAVEAEVSTISRYDEGDKAKGFNKIELWAIGVSKAELNTTFDWVTILNV